MVRYADIWHSFLSVENFTAPDPVTGYDFTTREQILAWRDRHD
jgi:hypothetical protein